MRQFDMDKEERRRSGLNELRVTDTLKASQAQIVVHPIDEDVTYAGPIVWSDINNIAIQVENRVKVFLKTNIQHWDYAASA